jgi:hypothetical protein
MAPNPTADWTELHVNKNLQSFYNFGTDIVKCI